MQWKKQTVFSTRYLKPNLNEDVMVITLLFPCWIERISYSDVETVRELRLFYPSMLLVPYVVFEIGNLESLSFHGGEERGCFIKLWVAVMDCVEVLLLMELRFYSSVMQSHVS